MNSKAPILLVGSGRSGTNWLLDILSGGNTGDTCVYHEPCSPTYNPGTGAAGWYRYVRASDDDPFLKRICDRCFAGQFTPGFRGKLHDAEKCNKRIIVKEIAAAVSVEWMAERYKPRVVVIVRHPCAVVLSDVADSTTHNVDSHPWSHAERVKAVLQMEDLMTDHLHAYRDVITKAETVWERSAVLWAVRNVVLERMVNTYPDWILVRYESLCADPLGEFADLYQRLNLRWTPEIASLVEHHSTTHEPGPYATRRISKSRQTAWRHEITPDVYEVVKRVVAAFNYPMYSADSDWSVS